MADGVTSDRVRAATDLPSRLRIVPEWTAPAAKLIGATLRNPWFPLGMVPVSAHVTIASTLSLGAFYPMTEEQFRVFLLDAQGSLRTRDARGAAACLLWRGFVDPSVLTDEWFTCLREPLTVDDENECYSALPPGNKPFFETRASAMYELARTINSYTSVWEKNHRSAAILGLLHPEAFSPFPEETRRVLIDQAADAARHEARARHADFGICVDDDY